MQSIGVGTMGAREQWGHGATVAMGALGPWGMGHGGMGHWGHGAMGHGAMCSLYASTCTFPIIMATQPYAVERSRDMEPPKVDRQEFS